MAEETIRVPNPRRVAAGRTNRLRRGDLTPKGRQRLRSAALKNRPWEHSTGPRTAEGKARVALNGKQQQRGSCSVRELREELAEVRQLVHYLATCRQSTLGGSG